MNIYQRGKKMDWNLENIRFLHPPDDFTGSFTNKKMQARHIALQEEKIDEINSALEKEENPIKAMYVLNRLEYIQFVTNNLENFKSHNCLEKAVLGLYYHKNTPFAQAGNYDTWKFFFENCDKDLLFRQGSELPHEKIVAYRGSVTGIAKGFSWTVDKDKVAWFLNRWADKSLGGGTIYSQEVNREDILVFIKDEEKQEVILKPSLAEGTKAIEVTSL